MAYRPGIISNNEDYVGELKALRRRLLSKIRQPVAYKYDSEEELIAESDNIDRIKYNEDILKARRLAYCLYWASEKAKERESHSLLPHWAPCPSCGLCQCRMALGSDRFRCLCPDGKKMLSPYRIVFLNSQIREYWRTTIYEIGRGPSPKNKVQSPSPDWKELSW